MNDWNTWNALSVPNVLNGAKRWNGLNHLNPAKPLEPLGLSEEESAYTKLKIRLERACESDAMISTLGSPDRFTFSQLRKRERERERRLNGRIELLYKNRHQPLRDQTPRPECVHPQRPSCEENDPLHLPMKA